MVLLVILALVLLAAGVILLLRGSAPTSSPGTSETISQIETSYGFAAAPIAHGTHHSPLTSIPENIGALVQRVLGTGERGIRRQLLAAGMYEVEPTTIVGYRLLALLGADLLWIWLAVARGFPPVLLVLALPVFGAMGWMLPVV